MRHRHKKRFGQHFLIDDGVIEAIVEAISPVEGDRLVEIGPGLGALTKPLIDRIGSLAVVEIDRDLIAYWKRWKERYSAALNIVEGDALAIDLSPLVDGARLVGNLPYNISTPILMRLTETAGTFVDAHFMLQKEVVDRMAADPGSKAYGRLSVTVQTHFDVERLFDVPPEAFDQPPKVDSAVVRLHPTRERLSSIVDHRLFEEVVRRAFSQRRKTIANALKGLLTADDFVKLSIDPGSRAEALAVGDFIAMANGLAERARSVDDEKAR